MPSSVTGSSERRLGAWLGLLLFLALLGLFLGPCLDGDVFVSTQVVHHYTAPWNTAWDERPPVDAHNPFLSDHSTIYLPWLHHTRAELREGRFPLWSPESYAGAPYFGNFSVGLLSPFTWLFVLLPFGPAFAIVAALKWTLAAVGTWLLARRLGLSGVCAWLPAIAYAFAGYQVVWINSALTHVSVLAPWCLLAVERARERPDGRAVVWIALTQFLQLMGGHPETSFYVAVACGVYALLRSPVHAADRIRTWGVMAAGFIGGAALSAVQVLPFLEYAGDSEGQRLREADVDLYEPWVSLPWGIVLIGVCFAVVVASFRVFRRRRWAELGVALMAAVVLRLLGLQPTVLLQVLPDFFGNPLSRVSFLGPLDGSTAAAYLGPLTYTDVCGGFVGSATFLLAILGLCSAPAGVRGALGLGALLLVAKDVRLPYVSQLLDALPAFGQTGGTRALAAFALLVVVLAGFGLRALQRDPQSARRPVGIALIFLLGCALPIEELAGTWRAAPEPRSDDVRWELDSATWSPDSESWNLAEPIVIRGSLGADVPDRVTLTINGHAVDDLGPLPEDEAGRRPFEYVWAASPRVEEGRYRLEVRAAGGGEWGGASIDVLRPCVPSGSWFGLAAAAGLLLAAGRLRPRWCTTGLVLVTVGELIVFGADYNDVTPAHAMPSAIDPIPLVQETMQEDLDAGRGPSRILGAGTALQPNLHYLFGLHVLRGYDALEPRPYVASLVYLWEGAEEGLWSAQDFSTLELGGAFADSLNLRWLLRAEGEGEEVVPDAGWEPRWRGEGVALYENLDVLPRAYTVQHVHSIEASGPPDPAQFLEGTFLREHAVRDAGPNESWPGASRVSSIRYRSGEVEVDVDSPEGCQLVLSENAMPGWSATIDGESVGVERVNGFMLSVEVPGGAEPRRVRFSYEPASYRWGWAISLATALVLGGVGFRRRRGRSTA